MEPPFLIRVDILIGIGRGPEPQLHHLILQPPCQLQIRRIIHVIVLHVHHLVVSEPDITELPIVFPISGQIKSANRRAFRDPEQGVPKKQAPIIVTDTPDPVISKRIVLRGKADTSGNLESMMRQPPSRQMTIGGKGSMGS